MTCEEKPELKEKGSYRNRRVLILLSATLGLTIVIAGFLELFRNGVPLGLTIPFLNVNRLSGLVCVVTVVAVAAYIGFVGLRELVVEKRFSVEFLMSVAALGAFTWALC